MKSVKSSLLYPSPKKLSRRGHWQSKRVRVWDAPPTSYTLILHCRENKSDWPPLYWLPLLLDSSPAGSWTSKDVQNICNKERDLIDVAEATKFWSKKWCRLMYKHVQYHNIWGRNSADPAACLMKHSINLIPILHVKLWIMKIMKNQNELQPSSLKWEKNSRFRCNFP